MKYKVGDRVVTLKTRYNSSFMDNQVGTVKTVHGDNIVDVIIDNKGDMYGWSFYIHEITRLTKLHKALR